MSTPVDEDSFDDIQIGSGYYVYGIDQGEVERVADALDRAEAELTDCDRSLERLDKTAPVIIFTIDPVPGHSNGNPIRAWHAVEDSISEARFGPRGIAEVARHAFELREKILRASARYAEAEREIEQRMRHGRRIAENWLASARHVLANYVSENAVDVSGFNKYLPHTLMDWPGAVFQGDPAELFRSGIANLTVPGMIISNLRPDVRAEIIDELMGMIFGAHAVVSSPEIFVAGMYGIYDGTLDGSLNPFAAVLKTGPVAFLLNENIKDALESALAEPLPETVVRLEQASYAVIPPATYAEIAERVAQQYIRGDSDAFDNEAQFTIEVITQPNGEQVARVYMAGMRYPHPHDSHPNDAAANFSAIQQHETAQSRAVKEALLELGLPQGTKVSFSGHSKGGIDAINLSMDADVRNHFNVVSVETFGSPTELLQINGVKIEGSRRRNLPPGTQYIHLQHNGDPVPGFDLFPPSSGPNRTDFRLSEDQVVNPDAASMVVEAHAIENYAKSAQRVEKQGSPEFERWHDSASQTLGQAGTESVTYTYRVSKAGA